MNVQVIDAAEWDHAPVRNVLVFALTGTILVASRRLLEDAERGGLVTCEDAPVESVRCYGGRPFWSTERPALVSLTETGRNLALRLAHSDELCMIVERHGPWLGARAHQILAELDLRAGGHLQRPQSGQQWDRVRRLPRRGLDG